ncbi:MAG: SH3 domain-containing protein [Candidatus Promineofilum sp.]|nr:SH3 domain-containing protein [Promineifilum sp.]
MRLDEAIVAYCDPAEVAALDAHFGGRRPTVGPDEQVPEARAAAVLEAAGRAGRAADLTAALAAAHPAVAWATLPWPPAALAPLHADLCRRHTLDSLRTLCFRLGLDYDELPGETKSGRARELLLAMNRAGRTMELWGEATYERRETSRGSNELRRPKDESRNGRASFKRMGLSPLPWPLNAPFTRISHFVSRLSLPVVVPVAAWAVLLALAAMDAGNDAVSITQLTSPAASPARSPSATPTIPLFVDDSRLSTVPLLTGYAPLPTASLPADPIVIVGPRGANLRRGPSAGFALVATLRAGVRLELLAVSPTGEWYQVRFPGHGSPWIDAGYAEIAGGTGGLPVATFAAASTAVGATAEPGSRPVSGPAAGPSPRPTLAATATDGAATSAPTRTAPPPPVPLPTLPPP